MTERRALWALLAAAFAARALYCWGASPYAPGDSVRDIDLYQTFALSVLKHGAMMKGGALSAAREPLYPMFMAALYALFGANYPVIWLAHCALGTAAVWLIFGLAGRVFSRNVAWAAAGMASFYPQFIYYAAQPLREVFQVFIVLAGVGAVIAACREPSTKRFAAAALLWAACPLTNSTLLPAGALAAAGIWLFGPRLKRDYRGRAALFLAVYLGVYALWPLRNFAVFKRFIPGVTAGGAHLYVSLLVPNEAAGTAEEASYIAVDPVMQGSRDLAEDEKDRYFYRASARWVAERPGRFLGVMAASFIKLWRFYPYPRDYGMNYGAVKLIGLLSDGWVIPLGLAGLILAGRRFPETDVFNLVLFAVTFTYMVFWAVVRYRLPMMPYVLIYAAYALECGVLRLRPEALPFPVSRSA